jgi:phage shock protein PspC (stress-responsive transcriptional regulator)
MEQGCQMVSIFSNQKANIWINFGGSCNGIGIFYGDLVYFTVLWYIFCPFGIFCDYLVYFVIIWYIFSVLLCTSGNPAMEERCASFVESRS